MSDLGVLLGRGEPMCKIIDKNIAVHWYPATARKGTPCLCGETRKGEKPAPASTRETETG